jgi:phosphatidylglycerophosphate synthase
LAAFFIVKQDFVLALIFFVIASILDSIDGSVARNRHQESKEGAYLDTIIDRYVEGITLFSLLFLSLPTIFLPGYAWVYLALFGSITTTYSKAAAKEKNMVKEELKGGLFSRGERLITISLILFFAIIDRTFFASTIILIIMSIFVNITAIQRINMVFNKNNN